MIGQAVVCTFPVSRVVTLKRGKGIWHVEVDGWMTSVQRFAFPWFNVLVSHREMCPPTAHHSRSGDHLLGRCLCGRPFWAVLSSCSTTASTSNISQQCQARAWGHPRVLNTACVKTRGVLAQRPPSSLHPRHPPSDRAAGVSLSWPRLISSATLLLLPHLGTLPYCPLPAASLAWIGARLPGCEASPKHGDTREPAMAAGAWSMAHVVWTRGREIRSCML